MSQTQTKVLKNGIPSFDANGYATMLPTANVTNPFGLTQKTISFREAPYGVDVYILISDLGSYPVPIGFNVHGFMGLCFKYNIGGLTGFGAATINAVASYDVDKTYGVCLSSTNPKIKPCVVKYNGHAYIGIIVTGNSGSLKLVGQAYNLLDTPIILNNRDGMDTANAEILTESPSQQLASWGGVIYSFSKANKASTLISKKGGWHEYIDNYAYKASPRVLGGTASRNYPLGLQRIMDGFRGYGAKEPQSAAGSGCIEMRGCGYSRSRMDESRSEYSQSPGAGQWRMAANDAIRFGSDNTTVLLMDDSTKRLYPQEKFRVRKRRLGRLESARFRSVALGKEVAA